MPPNVRSDPRPVVNLFGRKKKKKKKKTRIIPKLQSVSRSAIPLKKKKIRVGPNFNGSVGLRQTGIILRMASGPEQVWLIGGNSQSVFCPLKLRLFSFLVLFMLKIKLKLNLLRLNHYLHRGQSAFFLSHEGKASQ